MLSHSDSLQPHGWYPTLCSLMVCTPPASYVRGDILGKNTGVGCHALLQGIFPSQGSNPGSLHCRLIPYRLSHQGRPSPSQTDLWESCPAWHAPAPLEAMSQLLFLAAQVYLSCNLISSSGLLLEKTQGARQLLSDIEGLSQRRELDLSFKLARTGPTLTARRSPQRL